MKMKKIMALVCAGLLVLMYILTLVFAMLSSPAFKGLFLASVACTIIIPVLIYAYSLVYKVIKDRANDIYKVSDDENDELEETECED